MTYKFGVQFSVSLSSVVKCKEDFWVELSENCCHIYEPFLLGSFSIVFTSNLLASKIDSCLVIFCYFLNSEKFLGGTDGMVFKICNILLQLSEIL